jgi:exopolysaccharide biosynthesis WecB/TagA/CpsF family protein
VKTLAAKINFIENENEALNAISQEVNSAGVSVVSFINAHAYTIADASAEFKDCLLNASLLLRDGIGAKILLKHYNKSPGFNANGTDLIPLILARFKDSTVCFIGTESPYIDTAAKICNKNGNNIKGYIDGFQTTQTMFEFVNQQKPVILILGMGMPKQEQFALFLQQNYEGRLLVINGGAIFDFIAERFMRAPAIFRKLGVEWLYRLLNEPLRLFKRYVIGIPKFFWILRRNSKSETKTN